MLDDLSTLFRSFIQVPSHGPSSSFYDQNGHSANEADESSSKKGASFPQVIRVSVESGDPNKLDAGQKVVRRLQLLIHLTAQGIEITLLSERAESTAIQTKVPRGKQQIPHGL